MQAHPPRPEGPRPGAARGVVDERRAGRRLHGRRPLDRPRRAAPPRRPARVGPQRRRDRHPPRRRLARRARAEARGDLPQLQPAPAGDAAQRLLRRAVRLQGGAVRRRPRAAAARRGRGLVLRHRAAGRSPSTTGCASTRCRSTGSTTPTRGSTSSAPRKPTCRASGACCAGSRAVRSRRIACDHAARATSRHPTRGLGEPARAVRLDRRREHGRVRVAVRCSSPARSVRSPPTSSRSACARSPTPPRTGGSRSRCAGVPGGARHYRAALVIARAPARADAPRRCSRSGGRRGVAARHARRADRGERRRGARPVRAVPALGRSAGHAARPGGEAPAATGSATRRCRSSRRP